MEVRGQKLSRRKFLLASSAAAGALAIPSTAAADALLSSSPKVGQPARRAAGDSLATTGSAPIVGATVSPKVYGVSNWLTAAVTFDSYVGLPMAVTAQKIYMTQGQYYSNPLPAHITSLASGGCQFIICVYPSATTDESAKLASFLQLLNSDGIVYQAALVNEWNTHSNSTTFPTPQAYLNYWSHYAPVIQAAGVKVSSLVCASSNKTAYAKIQPGFPSNPLPDAYWIDYYATAYYWKVRLDTSGGLLDQAESAGVPVGIAEFGWAAGSGTVVTMNTWNAYTSYLSSLAPRLPLGCLYWGSGGLDVVSSSGDPKVPGIDQVASASF
jgi:hypothetical protein